MQNLVEQTACFNISETLSLPIHAN